MPHSISARPGVGLVVVLHLMCLAAATPAAQPAPGDDSPARVVPARPSRRERDRLEARRLYGTAVLRQREDQVITALELFEEARRLDPESVAVCKALVPLYMVLGRADDALKTSRAILDLNPDDVDTRYLLGRQLKDAGRTEEAVAELTRAAASPQLDGRPDLKLAVHFNLGTLYEEAKRYSLAAAAYGEVVAILEKPDQLGDAGDLPRELLPQQLANTYERIGSVSVLDKRYDQAVIAFRAAQKKDPAGADRLYFNLAQIAIARERWQEALDHLTRYLRTQPTGSEAYTVWATVMERLDRKTEIADRLLEYAEADKHNGMLRLLLADRLADDGRPDDAVRQYRKVVDDEPTFTTEAYRGLFRLYVRTGEPRLILTELNKALEMAENEDGPESDRAAGAARSRPMIAVLRDSPDLVKALLAVVRAELERGKPIGRARFYLAVFAARTKQLDSAEKLFRECLTNPGLAPDNEAAVYDGLIRVLTEQKRYADAIGVCRRGLSDANATNRLLFRRYMAAGFASLGKFKESLKEADEVVSLSDDEHRLAARLFRVRLRAQADRTEDAVREAEELLRETTDKGKIKDIRMTLSGVYSQAHDLPKSEHQLELVLKEFPDDPTANNDLGYIWADQGKNLEDAERLVRKALDLDREQKKALPKEQRGVGTDDEKDNAAYLDSLGWVLFRRGRLTEAREWLEKATASGEDGEDPVIFDHLGDVYYRLRDTDRARVMWDKALTLYEAEKRRKPDARYTDLKHKLELLKQEPPAR